MPKPQLEAIRDGAANGIDLIIGTARDDGRVGSVALPGPKTLGMMFFNNGMFAGLVGKTKQERQEKRAAYRRLMPDTSKLRIEEQLQTDALYRQDLIRMSELHSEQTGKTFMYQFNWEAPVFGGVLGAIHGLDAVFAFNNLDIEWDALGDRADAQPLADAMSDAWVAFAKTGTPSSPALPVWPEYDTTQRQTMLLDRTCTVYSAPDEEIRRLWARS